MLPHLICLIPIVLLVVFGYLNKPSENSDSSRNSVSNDVPVIQESQASSASPILTDEENGVSIAIEIEQSTSKSASFILNLNNHAYDLSTMDIGGLSHLNNVPASSYELIDSQVGGHHAKARITFPTAPTGELHIGLNEELSFYFML